MVKKIVWEWERIDDYTARVKVAGGWMIRSGIITAKSSTSIALMFVPDTDWQWQPIEPYVDPQIAKASIAKDFKKD